MGRVPIKLHTELGSPEPLVLIKSYLQSEIFNHSKHFQDWWILTMKFLCFGLIGGERLQKIIILMAYRWSINLTWSPILEILGGLIDLPARWYDLEPPSQGSNWGSHLGLCHLRIGIFEKFATLEISKNSLFKAIFSTFFVILCITMHFHTMKSSIFTKMTKMGYFKLKVAFFLPLAPIIRALIISLLNL